MKNENLAAGLAAVVLAVGLTLAVPAPARADTLPDGLYVGEYSLGGMTEEEAETDCRRNVITRAVGTDCSVNIDGIITPIKEGDSILMCSDGLSNMVAKSGIKQILDMNISDEEKVDALISEANDNGGADNISVIIIGL